MRFQKCDFCRFDKATEQLECKSCSFSSNFELKDKLTAKEQHEWMKLTATSPRTLVGSWETGYRYVDSDTVIDAIIRKDIIGNTIENITKGKTKKNMKTKNFYELARSGGVDTLGRRNVKKVDDPIKNVYFNDPVTVVLWTDGSRTIVKAQNGEIYDPEKGLAMAIAKKFMGDNETKSNYYNVFKKFLPKPKPKKDGVIRKNGPCPWEERGSFNDRWHIWITHVDPKTGEEVGYGVYPTDYASKYGAERRAKQLWGNDDPVVRKWVVSKTNPWETEVK